MFEETSTIKYDLNKHQYYITDEYLQDNYGFSLGDELEFDNDNDIDKFIKRASNVIYSYIYKSNPDMADYKSFMIAKNTELRDAVANAVGELLYSISQYGYDNSSRTGIDSKVQVSFHDLETAELPVLCIDILRNAGLLWRGSYKTTEDVARAKAAKEF